MNGLLSTQPQEQEIIDAAPQMNAVNGSEPGSEPGALSEKIEPHIMEKVGEEHIDALEQVLEQGMKLLFSKETHEQLFSQIRSEDEIPIADELGSAATNIMLTMYQKSGNSIPGEVIIPAGAILLANAIDFINESKIAQVSEEQFGEALNIFVDVIQAKLDPEYEKRMREGSAMPQEDISEQPDPLTQGVL